MEIGLTKPIHVTWVGATYACDPSQAATKLHTTEPNPFWEPVQMPCTHLWEPCTHLGALWVLPQIKVKLCLAFGCHFRVLVINFSNGNCKIPPDLGPHLVPDLGSDLVPDLGPDLVANLRSDLVPDLGPDLVPNILLIWTIPASLSTL